MTCSTDQIKTWQCTAVALDDPHRIDFVQEMQKDLEAKRVSRDGLAAELQAERDAAEEAAAAAEVKDETIRALQDQLAGVQVRCVFQCLCPDFLSWLLYGVQPLLL